MPRYFFHVRDNDRFFQDLEGTDLPDINAARMDAIEGARAILAEKIVAGDVLDGQAFEITNKSGDVLLMVPSKDALRLS